MIYRKRTIYECRTNRATKTTYFEWHQRSQDERTFQRLQRTSTNSRTI